MNEKAIEQLRQIEAGIALLLPERREVRKVAYGLTMPVYIFLQHLVDCLFHMGDQLLDSPHDLQNHANLGMGLVVSAMAGWLSRAPHRENIRELLIANLLKVVRDEVDLEKVSEFATDGREVVFPEVIIERKGC